MTNYIFDRENTSFIKQLSKVEDLTHINCTEYDLAFSNIIKTIINLNFIDILYFVLLQHERNYFNIIANLYKIWLNFDNMI
ncbi:hypothetical protein BpHYR1_053329 [Brachionus plicatilis]|uniref:Uncharacterized protein n=1 Tax=Brachionus plicatilis TaxID=10195 RepID=A0A3M7QJJ1_BRAPC|nr:hypothetical protein BpHYR1_053329 [Brachionus plicatilis]